MLLGSSEHPGMSIYCRGLTANVVALNSEYSNSSIYFKYTLSLHLWFHLACMFDVTPEIHT